MLVVKCSWRVYLLWPTTYVLVLLMIPVQVIQSFKDHQEVIKVTTVDPPLSEQLWPRSTEKLGVQINEFVWQSQTS